MRALLLLILVTILALGANVGCAPAHEGEKEEPDATDETNEHGPSVGAIQQAITMGENDDGHDSVVALLNDDGEVTCTGVLVSPYSVVTAAHCLRPTPPAAVYFGSRPKRAADDGTVIDATETRVHPKWDEETLANDIGVIGLMERAPVNPARLHDDDSPGTLAEGLAIRIVGFGATEEGPSTIGRKRKGDTTIESLGDKTFKFRPMPSQTCGGDSGGAAFATLSKSGKEVLVGLTSSGDIDCKSFGKDLRIDAYADFINGHTTTYAARVKQSKVITASSGCSTSSSPASSSQPWQCAILLAACLAASRRGGPSGPSGPRARHATFVRRGRDA